jgi:mannose-6-phosphate isomerase-like protein (cupin superfamily)
MTRKHRRPGAAQRLRLRLRELRRSWARSWHSSTEREIPDTRSKQMTSFTTVNLMEIENSAGERSPEVEARFARSRLDSEHLGISHFRYAPGYRNTLGHSHREQEEVYVVVRGSGHVKLDDEIVALREWDVVRVAAQTIRAFEAGPEGIEFLAVGSDRPEGGDGIRATDWWVD